MAQDSELKQLSDELKQLTKKNKAQQLQIDGLLRANQQLQREMKELRQRMMQLDTSLTSVVNRINRQ